MMEFVDPDFDKKVDIDEWIQFLACSDEQLASNEWLLHKQTLNMQVKFASELTKKMMEMSRCVPNRIALRLLATRMRTVFLTHAGLIGLRWRFR